MLLEKVARISNSLFKFIIVLAFTNVGAQTIVLQKDTVCSGDTIYFSLSSTSNIDTVRWDLDDDGFFDDHTGLSSSFTLINKVDSLKVWARIIKSNKSIVILNKKIVISHKPVIDFQLGTVCQFAPIEIKNKAEKNYLNISQTNWQIDGSPISDSLVSFNTAGTHTINYKIQLTNGCANAITKVVEVYQKPDISIVSQLPACTNDTSSIVVKENNALPIYKYVWATANDSSLFFGSTTLKKVFTSAGSNISYILAVTSQGCKDTVQTTFTNPKPIPLNITAPNDSLIITGNTQTLSISNNFSNAIWSNGMTGNAVSISQPGLYWVQASDANNCKVRDSMLISEASSKLEFENNTITMNSDGVNDFFKIKNIELYKELSLAIYNRYSQQVYTAASYDNSFDGMAKGKELEEGTYVYIINADGTKYTGDLTILK